LEHEAALKNLISLSSDALKNRQTLLKNQLSGVEAGSSKTNMGQVIINKILSVPGIHGNVLVGHIALANPEKDYNENDLLKIERLASIFALGIRHKQAEEEVRRLNMELEQRVLERTKELEAANKELESFSYSISHDLRAPLRAIEGLSRIAEDEFGASAPPEAARLITAIRSNTLRMGQLIDDLLRFSRLTRLPIKKELVNHNRLVVDALQTLTDQQIGRQIEIIILSLPDCQGDPSLLLQVWINLISNALKFTRKNNYAKLEIGFKMDEHSRPAYYVNDNGVGFDMKYAGKLFGVFQRLHNEKDFDGTGVGLALVSRIINRHGGNIWAESAPNAGATFYFTL
jgi:light-regulated signal transduction histidine kinase (bacteriophytochrome)